MPKKAPKVIEKKLGRHKAVGLSYVDDNLIEIDPRQSSKEYMLTLIHEKLHLIYPDWAEEQIVFLEKKLGNFLWRQNYRKVSQ